MNSKETLIRAERCIFNNRIELYLAEIGGAGRSVATKLILEHVPDGSPAEPFLTLKTGDAQRLIDELWDCGLRPSEGSGSAGALAATERHLKDMQEIARTFLGHYVKQNVEIAGK